MTPSSTPAALAAGATDHWPSGTIAVIRVTTNGVGSNLKGMTVPAEGDGAIRKLINYGTGALVLEHRTGATSSEQFWMPGSTNYTVPSLGAVELIYDGTSLNGWLLAA
jgi:hypothetical protein